MFFYSHKTNTAALISASLVNNQTLVYS